MLAWDRGRLEPVAIQSGRGSDCSPPFAEGERLDVLAPRPTASADPPALRGRGGQPGLDPSERPMLP